MFKEGTLHLVEIQTDNRYSDPMLATFLSIKKNDKTTFFLNGEFEFRPKLNKACIGFRRILVVRIH